MQLRELKLGHEAKCTCELCRGTGVYKNTYNTDGLAIVCNFCNGRGYYTVKLGENVALLQDAETGVVYKIKDAMIEKPVELFRGLKRRNDVEYVTYATTRVTTPEEMAERGATEVNFVSYQNFLQGELPLPIENDSCPAQFTEFYGKEPFENGCQGSKYSECPKFLTGECWDLFYGDAMTPIDIQNVLRKVK